MKIGPFTDKEGTTVVAHVDGGEHVLMVVKTSDGVEMRRTRPRAELELELRDLEKCVAFMRETLQAMKGATA